MKSKKIHLFLLIIIALTIMIILLCIKLTQDRLSYEEFNNFTHKIYADLLEPKYNCKILSPVATAYPGNPQKKWTKEQFNILDNNIATPKSNTVFIFEGDITTRIDFTYEPKIKSKLYLNVSRTDSHNFDSIKFPSLYSGTFTSRGIVFQITTFIAARDSLITDTSYENKMIKLNRDIILEIQEFILKNNY